MHTSILNIKNNAVSIAGSFLLGLAACSAPTLDGTKWKCTSEADCLEGYICNANGGYCEQSVTGTNGIFDDRLVLGMSSPLNTGPVALGQGMRDGISAYFRKVNAQGGVHGRRVELTAVDDGYDPPRALANVTKMIDAGEVFAIIGNVGTPTANLTAPFSVSKKTIFFGAFTGAGLLRKDPPERYVFNYRSSYRQETAAIVDYFTGTREPGVPARNIGVLPQGENSEGMMDAFGQSGFDGVALALKKAPHNIETRDVFHWTYKRNTVEVIPAIEKFLKWMAAGRIKDGDGKITVAIVMVPTYKPAAAFVKGLVEEVSAIQRNVSMGAALNLTAAELAEIKLVREVVFSSVSFVGTNDLATELAGFGKFTNAAG